MSTRNEGECVPLVRASAIIRRRYHVTLNLVLSGELEGFQDERGRWYVRRVSLEQFAATRGAPLLRPT